MCDKALFEDGFESSLTAKTIVSTTATGTWLFSLDFEGSKRNFAIELLERPNGNIVGYLLGATRFQTLVSGDKSASTVSLQLELINPSQLRTLNFSGPLAGDAIAATVSGDITTQPANLRRVTCELTEQALVAAQDTGGPSPGHVTHISVVLDAKGDLVSGGFVGEEDCDLFACDGGITSFSESGDTLTLGLETDGGCSADSSFSVDWNPGGIYNGSFNFTDCDGSNSGSVLAAFTMGTSSKAIRESLAARAEIANALEAGLALTGPLTGVAVDFLHFGKTAIDIQSELNAELSHYSAIQVELRRFNEILTSEHPRALADLIRPVGISVDEIRSGVPVGPGSTRMTYRDTKTKPIINEFGIIEEVGGVWKLVGNKFPAFDLPFDYTIPPGGSRLEAATADGNPSYISLGPYGAHFLPLTGDPSGEAKANFTGFLVSDDSEMEELIGNANGLREEGETWGYPIGGDLSGDRIRLRRPVYNTPIAGHVISVIYNEAGSGAYFDNEPSWQVEVDFSSDLRIAFGHVGRIANELRNLVLAQTGVDTDVFSGPTGTNLLTGFNPIEVSKGTELAYPQIFAEPVPGFPGYFKGGGSFLEYPWAQIEFQVPHSLGEGSDLSGDFCIYRFLGSSRQTELQAVMDNDMLDVTSPRYGGDHLADRWQWGAEGSLCQAESPLPGDFSSLYTSFGGWSERPAAGTAADEMFGFIPIDTTAVVYDAANYDSASVRHLVVRNKAATHYTWTMPDATMANVFLAAGEIIDLSDDTMLIKWRDFNPSNTEVFQRAAYRLNDTGLTIKWGAFASSAVATVQPVLAMDEACDDTSVLCYDHALGAWPP